jgi:hypothetical protein
MGATVRRALAGDMLGNAERLLRAGARILDATRVAIDGEVQALETLAAGELAHTRRAMEEARGVARRAIETFLVLHELPGTEVVLRLAAAGDDHYAAEATLGMPFGVDASFALLVPDAHEWGTPRRVGDLSPGTQVHAPLESGLIFRKIEVQAVKLDRYFVSAARIGPTRSTLLLRRQPSAGPGFKLDFDASTERVRALLTKVVDDGTEALEPTMELTGEDATHALRLRRRVIDSTHDLAQRRTSMTRGTYEGHALNDFDEPRLIAERIVRCLAPVVREIARRAGAEGELVLRRAVRAGRRDEVYITTAELQEKVLTLPPAMRATFAPFALDGERSPRAPAPSLSAYDDVTDGEVEEISQVAVLGLLPAAASS